MSLIINLKRKNLIVWLIAISCLSFIGCKNNKTKEAEAPLKKVKYTIAGYKGEKKQKTFNGETQSASITNLSFRMGGIITKMNATVGRKVKKGELLAQLDTREIDLSYQQINEAVRSSKVQLEIAQSTLDRAKRLYQAQAASLSDLEQARNGCSQAKAAYESNLKSLSLTSNQYNYAKIIAPTSGIISKVYVEKNEVVKAGANIITIDSDNNEFQVKVSLPENYINEVRLNDEVVLVINDVNKQGVISEIGYVAQGASFPITINIVKPDSNLRPGLSASVTFKMDSESQNKTLLVPIEAVRQDESGNFMYQLISQENGIYQVVKTTIEIGEISGNYFNVISGICQGDYIAIAGLNNLYDGMQVQLFKN
ncbi:efflux RND transporter periplasmic adaptor subunit [Flavivirga sp. 57AJ16]|uniref:efflux RND transporter periplasmic adaptor subunit n=1 Tax=Flavivirga sp. 57AJ16 TaxID=3025307 RepID=UPI00236717D8|nr:efflux RND transporter periplasmic adaptor subunit [Flavivirga sp. 57AJ16]MDD7886929.1 efflux RND transporter periplasmic adaptor subunit [Flavivirga sp. 57AJ16]